MMIASRAAADYGDCRHALLARGEPNVGDAPLPRRAGPMPADDILCRAARPSDAQ